MTAARSHLPANVVPIDYERHRIVPIGIERSKRNHPSSRPYDGKADPLPLALWQRQLLATEVQSWKSTAPTGERIDAVVAMLLGVDDDGGVA